MRVIGVMTSGKERKAEHKARKTLGFGFLFLWRREEGGGRGGVVATVGVALGSPMHGGEGERAMRERERWRERVKFGG